MFQATFRGRELLYPQPFGKVTAGADKDYPVDYSHLNIMGYALGAKGVDPDPDQATFPTVDTETEFGVTDKVKMKVPIFTGALGSTDIARKNWNHFAIGAAISGISLVCGENVCGIDPELELDGNGKVKKSPEMDRRVESYRRYHDGYGDILVQMNVEDTRNGVAEYVIDKLGVETMELKWGQGAKCIGGEIKVNSLERALELKKRGYIVTPDPENPAHQAAFKAGPLKQFERHSRLGFIDQEGFMQEVERLRKLGAKRITLKTGAYPMRELAMAIRWSSDAEIDLLTIDGAPGGTGMSPWRMMTEWGIPSIYLHSMAYELSERLAARGKRVPDLAFAGGFSSEDHVFKALALGADGIAISNSAMQAIGCVAARMCNTNNCPAGIATQKEELRSKLNIENSANQLNNFFTASTELMKVMARACGHDALSKFEKQDLATWHREIASLSGVKYSGFENR
jgi:glutamate synthase domain-containing protein 2